MFLEFQSMFYQGLSGTVSYSGGYRLRAALFVSPACCPCRWGWRCPGWLIDHRACELL